MDQALKSKLKGHLKDQFASVGHKLVKVSDYEQKLAEGIKEHFNFFERLAINPLVKKAVDELGDIDPKRDAEKLKALGKHAPDGTVGIYLSAGKEALKDRAYVHSGAVEKVLSNLLDSPEVDQLSVPASLVERYMGKAVSAGFSALKACCDHSPLHKAGKLKALKV